MSINKLAAASIFAVASVSSHATMDVRDEGTLFASGPVHASISFVPHEPVTSQIMLVWQMGVDFAYPDHRLTQSEFVPDSFTVNGQSISLSLAYPTSPNGSATIFGGIMLPASIYNDVPVVATFDGHFVQGTSSGGCGTGPILSSCIDRDVGYYSLRATDVPAVPEPSALAAFAAGAAVVWTLRRKK